MVSVVLLKFLGFLPLLKSKANRCEYHRLMPWSWLNMKVEKVIKVARRIMPILKLLINVYVEKRIVSECFDDE